jgi:hypothetical protein
MGDFAAQVARTRCTALCFKAALLHLFDDLDHILIA